MDSILFVAHVAEGRRVQVESIGIFSHHPYGSIRTRNPPSFVVNANITGVDTEIMVDDIGDCGLVKATPWP